MQRCLNNITLGTEVPFADSVLAASKAGFEGLEIFSLEPAQRYAESSSVEDLMSMFDQLSIQPVGFVLGGFAYQSDEEFSASLPAITETMSFAGEIGAENALLFIPSKGERGEAEAIQTATHRIAETCDLASDYGLTIGLEPIGKADFLNTPAAVYGIMEDVQAKNLALTVDLFHFYTGGCETEDLLEIPGSRINLVHMDDAPNLPIQDLEDSKRVIPGQGSMDVQGFLRALRDIGFAGPLSVELFNRDLWSRDPAEVAMESKRALDEAMKLAGVD
jgi:sugar phosphate isomerase/epimerase